MKFRLPGDVGLRVYSHIITKNAKNKHCHCFHKQLKKYVCEKKHLNIMLFMALKLTDNHVMCQNYIYIFSQHVACVQHQPVHLLIAAYCSALPLFTHPLREAYAMFGFMSTSVCAPLLTLFIWLLYEDYCMKWLGYSANNWLYRQCV